MDTAHADALIELMVRQGVWLQPTLVAEEMTANIAWYRADPAWRYAPPEQDPELHGFPKFQGEDPARYRAAYARMKWFVRRFNEAGGSVSLAPMVFASPGSAWWTSSLC